MKLQRLRIEQIRQFREPLEIGDFAPGLNLFSGPNESGKSTLVRAIRAAFFERYRSSGARDLQPWGDSSAAPQVELEFVHQGQIWRLAKRFLKQYRCDLSVNGQAFSGDEAEERIAQLLGFQFSGKGASKAEHWGIPGLLWIEQGQGQELRDAVLFAGDHLKAALGASLGDVASSSGDDLLQAVEKMRGLYLTRTGRPTGAYREVEDELASVQGALQELDSKIDHYRQQVDRLSELRTRHVRDEAERPWEEMRRQQQEARQRFEAVTRLGELQSREGSELKDCRDNIALLVEQLTAFQKEKEERAERQKASDEARERLLALDSQQGQVQEAWRKARIEYEAARELVRKSRLQGQRQSLVREGQQLAEQKRKLEESLARAREVQGELARDRAELAECRVDDRALQELRELEARLQELRIRQLSIATRLTFDLVPGKGIRLGDRLLAGVGEEQLLQQTTIEIEGVGRLEVTPGGEDTAELARRLAEAEEKVASLLQALGVESLPAAERRVERFNELQVAVAGHQRLLQSHAPQGVESLEGEIRDLQVRFDEQRHRLSQLPDMPADVPAPEAAEERLEDTDDALKRAEQHRQMHEREIAVARQRVEQAEQECQRIVARLDSPDRQQREREMAQRLSLLRAEELRLQASLDARQKEIDAARPDILEQDIKRFGDSAAQLEAAFRDRKDALARLEAELEVVGAQGLEEERARCAVELEVLRRRHRELELRADAASLLLELLQDKRQQLTRRLQAPLQSHLNHYLRLLFPQADVEVDEYLVPGRLIRSGTAGDEMGEIDALSFGAREQLGLISRLAYADLLREADKPTLIILDDALVHSDKRRLGQMKRILFDASQRHQILLFTCHPEKWVDMGVPIRDLPSLVVA